MNRISTALLVLAMTSLIAAPASFAQTPANALAPAAVEEIFNQSLNQKKGMTIYIDGQVINGVFVKRLDANTIEVRNQTYSRIIIRVDRIDAIALS
jgi:hypothetical protein